VYGKSTHSLDAKGRVFVPKRLQPHLPVGDDGQRLGMLSRGFDGCLSLMSPGGFEREIARLETGLFAGPDGRRFQRMFFASTFPITLDKSGRLQIPKELRDLAELPEESSVELVGMRGRIEIWAAERWSNEVDAHQSEFDSMAPQLPDPWAAPGPAAANGSSGAPSAGGGEGQD